MRSSKREVLSLSFHPKNNQILVLGSGKGTISIWNRSKKKVVRYLLGHKFVVCSVKFSPNGKLLASGSCDITIKLWNVGSFSLRMTLSGHCGNVHSVRFSPDAMTLASGSGA